LKDDAILPKNLIKKGLSTHLKLKTSPLKSSALHNKIKWGNVIQKQVCLCKRNHLAKILELHQFSHPYARQGRDWTS